MCELFAKQSGEAQRGTAQNYISGIGGMEKVKRKSEARS
jgi:hypothetical protein